MKSLVIIFILSLIIFPFLSLGNDTITHNTPLTNNQTIVSNGDVFELGFFSLGNDNWFIGIWYKQIVPKTYVWVANRDTPITSFFGVLNVVEKGNIVLLDQAESVVSAWSSNVTFPEGNTRNTVAQLLDSGNFVLRWEDDENPVNYIWQSFDHPTDTLLPEMKLGWDGKTRVNRFLQSWKTNTNPGSGDYSFKMDPDGYREFFLLKNETITYRSGAWNGRRFSGTPEVKTASLIKYEYQNNSNEISYSFKMLNASVYSRLIMSSSGHIQRFTWVETSAKWSKYFDAPIDQCDDYLECGPYGICDSNASPVCTCMKGFRPKNQRAWDLRDGSNGCVRSSKLDCGSDGFLLLKNMKLPKSSNAFVDNAMSLSECGVLCKKSCSCAAYANMYITQNGSGCVMWEVDLLDMRECSDSEGVGQDLYVRVAASDLDQLSTRNNSNGSSNDNTNHPVMIVSFTIGGCVVAIILIILFYLRRRRRIRGLRKLTIRRKVMVPSENDYCAEMKMDELELPLFDLSNIAFATNNFSEANKLGEGGFGYVYKGTLREGVFVAVKRLSRVSDQGIEELQNEVRLIAKLQHRNLVRLLGWCIETEEKLLIYEFMENKSLNTFLFEKEKSINLNWQMRLDIIFGIARGLLYLHQDSRFKIIHRDLKASNILLDKVMNPKISDFGMARIFGSDQVEAKTKKVVGTYGYMSPEYAMKGHFSTKSDVFSFGVLVLEIVSGKKNTGSSYTSSELSLLGYTWMLWKEGNALELVDKSMGDKFSKDEVLRCIQIGLLCVQEHPEDRPSMSKVLLMLSSEGVQLPQPKYHAFFIGERCAKTEPLSKQDESITINDVTLTVLDAR